MQKNEFPNQKGDDRKRRKKRWLIGLLVAMLVIAAILFLLFMMIKFLILPRLTWQSSAPGRSFEGVIERSELKRETGAATTLTFLEEYPSETKFPLFYYGVGIRDVNAGQSLIYFDEVRKKRLNVPEPAILSADFAVLDNATSVFYINEGEIWRGDLAFRPQEKITSRAKATGIYSISPDGEYIVFENIEKEKPLGYDPVLRAQVTDIATALYIVKTDGTALFKLKTPEGFEKADFEAWYPDGKKALLRTLTEDSQMRTQTILFWELDIVKNTIKKFDSYGDFSRIPKGLMPPPIFSPDGKQFAYTANAAVRLASMDGTQVKTILTMSLANGAEYFSASAWSPDGKKLVVNGGCCLASENYITPKALFFDDDGNFLFEVKGGIYSGLFGEFVWSKDGRFLAIHRIKDVQHEKQQSWLTVIDTSKRTLQEYKIGGLKIPLEEQFIWGIASSYGGKFYYRVAPRDFVKGEKLDPSFPQLWMLDPLTGENLKISDNATLPQFVKVP
ncbi:MAG: PD40 domain-containing protein [Parcubacteria group bacterium]|nr:PD40 domain-containing protein [Parcubacteria group bacterium]